MSAIEQACDAIRRGDSQQLEELISLDSSLTHARDANGVSLLMLACYHRQAACVDALQAGGRDLDLFEAASLGQSSRVEELCRQLPEIVQEWSSDGFQPLHLAAFFGKSQSLSLLLQHGADPNAVAKNAMSVRPIHSAVASRNHEVVRTLVAHAAEINVQQHGGWTPLHAAALHGDIELTRYLLDCGANRLIKSDDGKTAGELAAANGHSEVAKLLQLTASGAKL